jgi:hypothetical protein
VRQFSQLAPSFVLLGLGRTGIFFATQPQIGPIYVALVYRVTTLRPVLLMVLIGIYEQFDWLLQVAERDHQLHAKVYSESAPLISSGAFTRH